MQKSSLIKRKEGKPNTISEFTDEAINYVTKTLQEHGYEISERLGLGGFSMIFKVKSKKNDKFYAAKIISVSSTRGKSCLITYQNEKKALTRLYHPNIIRLNEAFECGKFCFLIIELCSSKTLNDVIKGGTATVQEKITYMRQLLHAITHVHSCGYAHRDIKPANVLFDDFGHVKLADFGMCIKFKIGQTSSEYLGSPHYMAPEIYRRQPFDPFAADIWALGVTFYLLAGGKVNWPPNIEHLSRMIREEGILVHRYGLQPDVAQMVQQMLHMEPAHRPSLAAILNYPIFNSKMERNRSFVKSSTNLSSYSSKNPNLLKNVPPKRKQSTTSLPTARRLKPNSSSKNSGNTSSASKSKSHSKRQKSVTPVAPAFHMS